MKNKEKIICKRCCKNKALFYCHSCPSQFNQLCSQCDTHVHSIISYKKMHKRDKLYYNDNIEFIQEKKIVEEKIKNFEEKSWIQYDTIEKLNKKIKQFKEQINILIEENRILKKEKECFIDELNYLKIKIESFKKENQSMEEKLKENDIALNKINIELIKSKDILSLKENELREIKFSFDDKVSELDKEKKYLLNDINDTMNKLFSQKDLCEEKIEENNFLKNRISKLEVENNENLIIISQLKKENDKIIKRLNYYFHKNKNDDNKNIS